MRILSSKVYEGINLYSFQPVVKLMLDLGFYKYRTSEQLGDFNELLLEALPSLENHYCSKGRPGGFVQRLKDGTFLGHVVEHVALELQSLTGEDVIYGKTRSTEKEGVYEVIYEYRVKEAGLLAGQLALELVNKLLEGQKQDTSAIIKKIKEATLYYDLGPSTKAIVEAAKKRGIPVITLADSLVQLGYGKHQKRIGATITGQTSCLGVDIASDKRLTKELLYDCGIPVPKGLVITKLEEANEAFTALRKPIVVKPLQGNHGKGVTVAINTLGEMERAFRLAKNYDERVIIEEFVAGEQYRLLVIGGAFFAAAKRVPAYVVGNGKHSIKELVKILNEDPQRGEGHEKPLSKIRLDEISISTLAKTGYTPESILPKGKIVYLRESANLSTGAISIDVTDEINPQYKELAEKAAEIIGLDVAGIDIVAKNITEPIEIGQGNVIEVNAAPGLRMHLFPAEGKARDCGKAIVDYLYPKGVKSRIPLISVTGTNGKTTTVRLIANILATSGLKVGMTTTDGIYINKKLIMSGDMAGPKSAKVLLKDPSIDVAVLETARGGMLRGGLGYDMSDVGVITNISSDHLEQDGIYSLRELAHVKSLVIETVNKKGFAILNADDKLVMSLIPRIRCKSIYFSSTSDNHHVRRHLGAGGKALFIMKGFIVFAEGDKVQIIARVGDIPITMKGYAKHNIQNLLAALSGALALGVDLEVIRKGIYSFTSSLEDNPGRLNIFEIKGIKVVVDYGHNEAAYSSTLEMLKKIKERDLIGIIGVPGDRPDANIIEIGKISGKSFDRIFIKEDKDLRGRKKGEVAKILEQGALLADIDARKVTTILDEKEALKVAINSAQKGDIIVIFYEKIKPILQIIKSEIEEDAKKVIWKKRKNIFSEENNII